MLLDMKNRRHRDLKITVGTADDRVVLWAHKCKLIAHSDVFYAMFHYDTIERETNSVMIEDFAASAVKNMLIFVYVGSFSLQGLETRDIADLMRLADKYFIEALKALCEKELIARICSANVVDFVELADFCNAMCLHENCFYFMSNNRYGTLSSFSWQALVNRNPGLASSIMNRLFDVPL
uniref:BTB domain-containing protein n=1 Tax=Angiostrongylus cantonensis TaxID=6313 RepID=A0A0K0D6X5_ANGCA